MSATSSLEQAIANSQQYLLSQQFSEGYWWAELESNVSITAETLLLHKIWHTDQQRPLHKVEAYLRNQQRDHGGWELYYGDGGELSVSVEAYLGMRLLGVPASDPALAKARRFILERGGISKTRIFTKFHLAMVGCYEWRGIPSIPPWIMLLPEQFPFTIYEMSSWARGSTVPLLLAFDRKPVYHPTPGFNLNELYAEGIANAKFEIPWQFSWSDIFIGLDQVFKLGEEFGLSPWRQEGLKAAEQWVLSRQEPTGDWGGIIPAMLNSMFGLLCLNYSAADPVIVRGMQALDRFVIETETTYHVQPCVSPVWDTALVIRSLVDSGLPPDHPQLVKGGEWLLTQQILDYGDWSIKNPQAKPGGWAFEFVNRYYPDVDDTAVVVMALDLLRLPQTQAQKAAIALAHDWVASMQCHNGGWGAFDKNNDQDWLNALPYADLKAMIDPATADVTARVLEMVASCDLNLHISQLDSALSFLRYQQEPEGCWFGRWGVNYIYGTSGVLVALAQIAPRRTKPQLQKGMNWLLSCQNPDGGWGETCRSYDQPELKGQGQTTASQTAWALIGIMAASAALKHQAQVQAALAKGIAYLVHTQNPDGTWNEAEFTGTGFPSHFYLKYHLYQQHFPLTALGRYKTWLNT
ncbi:MAG: squalene--hopene cyclase [Pseudanabaenaceae cyanobacterium bins.68]|nr:squalene--hopene cyclase [Pseudanabaenaceae cyanobacterium bins.68]